jgi:rSAM/selenodomain-associated transferase 1
MHKDAKNHLIIFCKNPILGQCKTRLAASIGPEKALNVYEFLLYHTAKITSELSVKRIVYYSQQIVQNDFFDPNHFEKALQRGDDLGARMAHALEQSFAQGAQKVLIIGSDLYDISAELIQRAFQALNTHQTVIGPAKDGGYYLIGMTQFNAEVFRNKNWGSPSVFSDTLSNLKPDLPFLLPEKNDIDTIEDLHPEEIFKPLIS